MDLRFKVSGIVARPVEEVFEAVADPQRLSGYFTTGGASGRIETGSTVTWGFHDYPETFPVEIVEVEKNAKIVLRWPADDVASPDERVPADAGYNTTVTFEFTQMEDGRTLVTIAEEGWRPTQSGLYATLGNCQGWTFFVCALKVYLEHGINLRDGMFQ